MPSDFRSLLTAGLVVFALALAAYAGNLDHGFVFDDSGLIESNERIRELGNAGSFFTTPYWGAERNDGLYRPLTLTSYAMSYQLSELAPRGYHLLNNLLHAINSMLVLLVAWRIIGPGLAGWAAGVLFALHPVHTEAVNWIVGRAELLAALFVLGAVVLALYPVPLDWRRHRLRAALVLVSCLAGLFSKESALIAMPLVLLALWTREPVETTARAFLAARWPWIAGWILMLAVWAALRAAAIGDDVLPTPYLDNQLVAATVWQRICTAAAVAALWAGRLIAPFWFSVDYSVPKLPTLTTLLDPRAGLGLLVWLGWIVSALWSWQRRRDLFFWIACLGLAYLPTSNLLIVIGTLFGERLLYVPSIAVCGLLAFALSRLPSRGIALAVLATIATGYGYATVDRNRDWKDDATLFAHEVSNRPCSSRSLANYATSLQDDPAAALDFYEEAVSLTPEFADARRGFGTALLRLRRAPEAIPQLEAADRLEPDNRATLLNLGAAYASSGRLEQAVQSWERLLALDPGNVKVRRNLERARGMLTEHNRGRR